jgi:hypothetical protein
MPNPTNFYFVFVLLKKIFDLVVNNIRTIKSELQNVLSYYRV